MEPKSGRNELAALGIFTSEIILDFFFPLFLASHGFMIPLYTDNEELYVSNAFHLFISLSNHILVCLGWEYN